jgi:CTP:phosphocholine cytidylyltransferase-like protein
MTKIGIIGSPECYNSKKIKQILMKLKETYGNTVEIVSGGNRTGIEYDVKKYALELGFQFKEFNPAYTLQTGYSALNESYYSKKFHPTHDVGRYRRLMDYCNAVVVFQDNDQIIEGIIRYGEKKSKKIVKIRK